MNKQQVVAIDAMGGDHAPGEIIQGAMEAYQLKEDLVLHFFGDEQAIRKELKEYHYDDSRIQIFHAPEVIENTESPVLSIRKKKDSSIVRGLQHVKEGKAEAFLSAGSTGAVLAGGTLIIGRIKGIERPALASTIPTRTGKMLLLDCGANADSKAKYLNQFALLGSVYAQSFWGIDSPKVALLNNGEEEGKGNQLTKETYPLLKEDQRIQFTGNIEARYILDGSVDVVVADGFAGNLVLKNIEGVAKMMMSEIKEALMSSILSKVGALLIKKSMKKLGKKLDYKEYGGAPLLGLNNLVVKAHGSSDRRAIRNAVLQCHEFITKKVNDNIRKQVMM